MRRRPVHRVRFLRRSERVLRGARDHARPKPDRVSAHHGCRSRPAQHRPATCQEWGGPGIRRAVLHRWRRLPRRSSAPVGGLGGGVAVGRRYLLRRGFFPRSPLGDCLNCGSERGKGRLFRRGLPAVLLAAGGWWPRLRAGKMAEVRDGDRGQLGIRRGVARRGHGARAGRPRRGLCLMPGGERALIRLGPGLFPSRRWNRIALP